MTKKETHNYDDILCLSRPVSANHPPMAAMARAAQFSPFAALTGYEKALEETKDMAIDRVEHEIEAETLEDIASNMDKRNDNGKKSQ
ncbi:MAG: hypothetical protein IKL28_08585 [Lachnospiraceae bacterium]|nr:hypothetical protein [Lachnospiraceae bacterium]